MVQPQPSPRHRRTSTHSNRINGPGPLSSPSQQGLVGDLPSHPLAQPWAPVGSGLPDFTTLNAAGTTPLLEPVMTKKVPVKGRLPIELDRKENLPVEEPAPTLGRSRKRLSKQMSMKETTREAAWEKRRRQIMMRMSVMSSASEGDDDDVAVAYHEAEPEGEEEGGVRKKEKQMVRSLTDEDMDELRGSIELGFGFSEDVGGKDLRNTLPALDLYFAVNRQFSDPKLHSPSPVSSPMTAGGGSSSSLDSPRSPGSDSWKLLNPGDDPQHVKMKLKHWAQAVACSVRQCC